MSKIWHSNFFKSFDIILDILTRNSLLVFLSFSEISKTFLEDGKTVRGAVEVSGLDSESDILESLENAELPKEMLKIFTYPKHELVDKEMSDVTLLDRSLLAGDTVRRGKTGEIGTVISLDIKTDVRVLDTNIGLKNICAKR